MLFALQKPGAAHVPDGSNASVDLFWHVGFTPDSGRMLATQRTDASGHQQTPVGHPIYCESRHRPPM
jgi:hypothetical protein